jgi:hypothetical protein
VLNVTGFRLARFDGSAPLFLGGFGLHVLARACVYGMVEGFESMFTGSSQGLARVPRDCLSRFLGVGSVLFWLRGSADLWRDCRENMGGLFWSDEEDFFFCACLPEG